MQDILELDGRIVDFNKRTMNAKITMKTRKLKIYRDGEHIQTVTFIQVGGIWSATHFDRDKSLPFALHDTLEQMKSALINERLEWEWG